MVEAFWAAESSWTEQCSSVCKKCQASASQDSNQTPNEHLESDVNVLIKIIINTSTHMQYSVYTYKEATVLIMSLITTLVAE